MPGLTTSADAHEPMDHEPVIAATQSAQGAAVDMLELLGMDQAVAGPTLEEIARKLAEALHAVIGWHPARDDDDDMLLNAVARWL